MPMPSKPTQLTADTLFRPLGADQRTMAERAWQAGLQPNKPQLPADVGLFGPDLDQLDWIDEQS
jgi:hypothetical protein